MRTLFFSFLSLLFVACGGTQVEEPKMQGTLFIDDVSYGIDSISCLRFVSLTYEKEIFETNIYLTGALSELDTIGDIEEAKFTLKFEVKEGDHLFINSNHELPYLWFDVKRVSKATASQGPRYKDSKGEYNKLTIDNINRETKTLDLALYFGYRPNFHLPERSLIELNFKNVPIDWQD